MRCRKTPQIPIITPQTGFVFIQVLIERRIQVLQEHARQAFCVARRLRKGLLGQEGSPASPLDLDPPLVDFDQVGG
ncbi:MAG: hypothetical protein EA424_27645, partial [Planctomycetaceae bacterium]